VLAWGWPPKLRPSALTPALRLPVRVGRRSTFSPLAGLLPERTTPELRYWEQLRHPRLCGAAAALLSETFPPGRGSSQRQPSLLARVLSYVRRPRPSGPIDLAVTGPDGHPVRLLSATRFSQEWPNNRFTAWAGTVVLAAGQPPRRAGAAGRLADGPGRPGAAAAAPG
jgi:hypothetical protein